MEKRAVNRHGLARVLSKLGYCSRSAAARIIREGRVSVNGLTCHDPRHWTDLRQDALRVDGVRIGETRRVYLMVNKPRGLVTTLSDERGRPTVMKCLGTAALPHVSPVGRLDQASEGLLLLTNDTLWAERLMHPDNAVDKVYHVQIDRQADPELCHRLEEGIVEEAGVRLKAKAARVLRVGPRNAWLEIVLNEGRNRQIRRLLMPMRIEVLRLIRIQIGPLLLGNLPKGRYRHLTRAEVDALGGATR